MCEGDREIDTVDRRSNCYWNINVVIVTGICICIFVVYFVLYNSFGIKYCFIYGQWNEGIGTNTIKFSLLLFQHVNSLVVFMFYCHKLLFYCKNNGAQSAGEKFLVCFYTYLSEYDSDNTNNYKYINCLFLLCDNFELDINNKETF